MAAYDKPDFWSLKAQKEGYPARSVYKLAELDGKFGLLKPLARGGRALDLGAAPGSWSLYILRNFAQQASGDAGGVLAEQVNLGCAADCGLAEQATSKGEAASPAGAGGLAEQEKPLLAAADLLPLSRRFDRGLFDRKDFFFIQGDFTAPGVREALLARGPYSVLLSDAAPATSGNRTVDTARSLALAEEALTYAGAALERGGALAIKVFQGGDTGALLAAIRERFDSAKSFKPKACRTDSFETYLVGLGKK